MDFPGYFLVDAVCYSSSLSRWRYPFQGQKVIRDASTAAGSVKQVRNVEKMEDAEVKSREAGCMGE